MIRKRKIKFEDMLIMKKKIPIIGTTIGILYFAPMGYGVGTIIICKQMMKS